MPMYVHRNLSPLICSCMVISFTLILTDVLLNISFFSPAENASQICNNGDVRLSQGDFDYEGNVQVCFNGNWGTVCHDGWDYRDATTVCRTLGYNGTAISTTFRNFGQETGPIFLDEVGCFGNETSILQCRAEDPGDHDCSHFNDAGVTCSGKCI